MRNEGFLHNLVNNTDMPQAQFLLTRPGVVQNAQKCTSASKIKSWWEKINQQSQEPETSTTKASFLRVVVARSCKSTCYRPYVLIYLLLDFVLCLSPQSSPKAAHVVPQGSTRDP